MTYATVVVGTDGSETAQRAVRHAGRLAAEAGARLVVVTAYSEMGDAVAWRSGAPEDVRWMLTDRNLAEDKAREGKQLAGDEGASGVRIEALPGEPAEVVLAVARDVEADLIVVGSKGLTSPARFVLGSVATSVSHHAPCDVLIVHTT